MSHWERLHKQQKVQPLGGRFSSGLSEDARVRLREGEGCVYRRRGGADDQQQCQQTGSDFDTIMKISPKAIEAAPYWLGQDVGGVGADKNKHSTQ